MTASGASYTEAPASRSSRRGRRSGGRGGSIFGVCACALAFAAIIWAARSIPAPRPPAPKAPRDPWTAIVQPIPLFDLSDTPFGPVRSYQAWRASSGTGRRDVLTFGAFADGSSFLRLALSQPRPQAKPQPFFAAIARQAALADLAVDRSFLPNGLDTRFGLMAIADVTVSQRGLSRSCLAFRAANPALRLSGLACGAQDRPFGRPELVCALDRLDLLGGGSDNPLTLFLARSELARGRGCPEDRLAPIKPRTSWLDPGAALPRLETGEQRGRSPRLIRNAKL